MGTLTRLSQFALNKNQSLDFVKPGTALGQRLLDISTAYDEDTLDDSQVDFFLDELAAVCEKQMAHFENLLFVHNDAYEIPSQVLGYLESVLDLIEGFDQNSHSQLSSALAKLEWNLTQSVVSLGCAEAA